MVRRQRTIWEWEQLPAVIGVRELANLLKVSEQMARSLLRDGKIPACKVGRNWRIETDAVREFLKGGAA